jgi:1,4-dihydroxy-2-naphthoyl-CoA hydrolase
VEPPTGIGWPEEFTPAVALDRSFDARYGLEIVGHDVPGEGVVHGRVAVRDELKTEHGFVHGGVFAAAAEAVASQGTALAVMPSGLAAMGLSNDTTVLADVTDGAIAFEARVRSRGEDAWLWTVEATGDDGATVAFSRVTVAVRPFRR